jgi:hypothetical protein
VVGSEYNCRLLIEGLELKADDIPGSGFGGTCLRRTPAYEIRARSPGKDYIVLDG